MPRASTRQPSTARPVTGPPDIPDEIFQAALRTYLECRRLEMGQLAVELGMSRATLWRRTGSRDRLLGEVLWALTWRTLREAFEAAGDRVGFERVAFVAERYLTEVSGQPYFRRFLECESEIALRVLTSKDGVFQHRLIDEVQRLLEREHAEGLVLSMPADTLAYALVRIGESFLYADLIADKSADVGRAVELVLGMLRGNAVGP